MIRLERDETMQSELNGSKFCSISPSSLVKSVDSRHCGISQFQHSCLAWRGDGFTATIFDIGPQESAISWLDESVAYSKQRFLTAKQRSSTQPPQHHPAFTAAPAPESQDHSDSEMMPGRGKVLGVVLQLAPLQLAIV
jgi:hypothetical protein